MNEGADTVPSFFIPTEKASYGIAVQNVLHDKYAQHTITAYALLRYGIEKGIAPAGCS